MDSRTWSKAAMRPLYPAANLVVHEMSVTWSLRGRRLVQFLAQEHGTSSTS
jgi:hypothetical protein